MTPIPGNELPYSAAVDTSTNQKTATNNLSKFFKFLAFLPFATVASATSLSNDHREVSLIESSSLSENTAKIALSTFYGVENSSSPTEAPLFSQESCYLSEDTAQFGSLIIHDAQNISDSSESNKSYFSRWSEKGSGSKEALGMLAMTGLAFVMDDCESKNAQLRGLTSKMRVLINKVKDLTAWARYLKAKERDLKITARGLEAIVRDLEAKVENLANRLRNSKATVRDLKATVRDLEAKLRDSETCLTESNEKIEKLKDREREQIFLDASNSARLLGIEQLLDVVSIT